jgi:hypothetical protein
MVAPDAAGGVNSICRPDKIERDMSHCDERGGEGMVVVAQLNAVSESGEFPRWAVDLAVHVFRALVQQDVTQMVYAAEEAVPVSTVTLVILHCVHSRALDSHFCVGR